MAGFVDLRNRHETVTKPSTKPSRNRPFSKILGSEFSKILWGSGGFNDFNHEVKRFSRWHQNFWKVFFSRRGRNQGCPFFIFSRGFFRAGFFSRIFFGNFFRDFFREFFPRFFPRFFREFIVPPLVALYV